MNTEGVSPSPMGIHAMRLWFVDRSHWEIGEVAAFVVRAPTAERARQLVAEEGSYGKEGREVWLDPSKASVRPCTDEGAEGVVITDVADIPCCPNGTHEDDSGVQASIEDVLQLVR